MGGDGGIDISGESAVEDSLGAGRHESDALGDAAAGGGAQNRNGLVGPLNDDLGAVFHTLQHGTQIAGQFLLADVERFQTWDHSGFWRHSITLSRIRVPPGSAENRGQWPLLTCRTS